MKICLFSDIHANLYALEAALPVLLQEKADQYLFLGDLCGYYFQPVAAWQALQQLPFLTCIRGNHDNALLEFSKTRVVPEAYRKRYGPSFNIFFEEPAERTQPFLGWLQSLPEEYIDSTYSFRCVHSFPDQVHEYLYPDTEPAATDICEKFVFFGHTHYPLYKRTNTTTFVNPGSIGQPRNGVLPSFMSIILPDSKYTMHHIAYDKSKLVNDLMQRTNIPSYLIDVLGRTF